MIRICPVCEDCVQGTAEVRERYLSEFTSLGYTQVYVHHEDVQGFAIAVRGGCRFCMGVWNASRDRGTNTVQVDEGTEDAIAAIKGVHLSAAFDAAEHSMIIIGQITPHISYASLQLQFMRVAGLSCQQLCLSMSEMILT